MPVWLTDLPEVGTEQLLHSLVPVSSIYQWEKDWVQGAGPLVG